MAILMIPNTFSPVLPQTLMFLLESHKVMENMTAENKSQQPRRLSCCISMEIHFHVPCINTHIIGGNSEQPTIFLSLHC